MVSGNIKSGVKIFNVTGSMAQGINAGWTNIEFDTRKSSITASIYGSNVVLILAFFLPKSYSSSSDRSRPYTYSGMIMNGGPLIQCFYNDEIQNYGATRPLFSNRLNINYINKPSLSLTSNYVNFPIILPYEYSYSYSSNNYSAVGLKFSKSGNSLTISSVCTKSYYNDSDQVSVTDESLWEEKAYGNSSYYLLYTISVLSVI